MKTRTTKRKAERLIRNFTHGLPRIRVVRSRSSIVVPGILAAIGTVAIGTVAAVMLLRPRVRARALTAAKDAYGRVRDQIETMGVAEKLGIHHRAEANGMVTDTTSDYGPNAF